MVIQFSCTDRSKPMWISCRTCHLVAITGTIFLVPCLQIEETWLRDKVPGAHLSMKASSYKYRNSHYKDKTVSRPSYLYNGKNPHTCKDRLYIEMGPWILVLLMVAGSHDPFCIIIMTVMNNHVFLFLMMSWMVNFCFYISKQLTGVHHKGYMIM